MHKQKWPSGHNRHVVSVDFLVSLLILSIKYSLVNVESRLRFLHCPIDFSHSCRHPYLDCPRLAFDQNRKLHRMLHKRYKYQRRS